MWELSLNDRKARKFWRSELLLILGGLPGTFLGRRAWVGARSTVNIVNQLATCVGSEACTS